MGFTVFLIVFFGIAALIPAIWSIIGLIQGNRAFLPCVIGVAWATVLLLLTFIGTATDWGGCPVQPGSTSKDAIKCYKGETESGCKPDIWVLQCGQKPSSACTGIPARAFCPPGEKPVFPFCEPIEFGAGIKQPWATWSDLSFIAAGLWILWLFQYFGRRGTGWFADFFSKGDNPMTIIGALSITYGMIVIFMGPPSMWFHASIKEWAGWFDTMSVVIWLMFNAVYVIYLIAAAMWGKGRGLPFPWTVIVLSVWAGLVILSGIIGKADPDLRLILYFAGGVPWGIGEIVYAILARENGTAKYRRRLWLFLTNIGLLIVTMTIWVFFNDNIVGSGCLSRESFPGHALFHILASFSTILTFLSFASERKVK